MVVATPGLAFAALPHGGYSSTTNLCANCHTLHRAPSDQYLFSVAATASTSGEIAACYSCHDGAGAATNVKTGSSNSFALASGHRVENATETTGASYDLTNRCSGCHSPHSDYATNRRLPVRSVVTSSGTYAVTGANTTWCLACHNDANDWYKSTTTTAYPSMAAPTRDASGYPVIGTFPGKTVYNDTSKNRHAAIPSGVTTDPMLPAQKIARVTGDCLWCHVAHRASSTYDSLPATFSAPATTTVTLDRTRGDYAAACFTCHGGGSWEASGAVNIKQFAVKTPDDAAVTSGHRIKTTGAALPLNAPLPCYDCHNPHGSTRNNKMMLADTLGQSLDATVSGGVVTTAAGRVREFCFTCHSTSDATAKVWDSAAGAYTSATSAMLFQGLRRDGTLLAGQTRPSGYSLNQNYLKLKPLGGSDYHSQSSTKNCYDCHGKTYTGASAPNVHAPTMGVSSGGVACYGCHAEYQPMEDNAGSVLGGASRLTSYHHVMGSASNDGDYTPATSSNYPVSTTDVYCISCHVDHDLFNTNKGANLRSTIGAASATATNTDFIAPGTSGTPGICASCHTVALTKQNADQASSGTTYTVIINATGYAASAHNYNVATSFSGSAFRANCAKCHNDTLTKSFQASVEGTLTAFGVHTSSEARILARLGGTLTNPYEEQFCYKCHSKASESQGSTWTVTAMYDRYGTASMSAASVAIFSQMQLNFGHRVQDYSGKHKASRSDETTAYIGQTTTVHVECADCHDAHDAGKGVHTQGTNLVSPSLAGVQALRVTLPTTNWTTPGSSAYSWAETATYEYQICLKCHTLGANPALATWDNGSTDTWTDVALEFNTANNSYHPVMGPLLATDSDATKNAGQLQSTQLANGWTAGVGRTMYCSDCHGDSATTPAAMGPHGSSVDHLLKGPRAYWPTKPAALGGGLWTISDYGTANAGSYLFCVNCHPNSSVNDIHGKGGHSSYPCVYCHITVPHGGKISRLLGDSESGTGMPTRYNYGGNQLKIWGFKKPSSPTNTGYGSRSANCYVDSGTCGGHAGITDVNEQW
ncbi:MAG: hypothetical protein CVT59_11235 [Actinobacteria bacterium HGW-Actinobacteria-1]|nr:MAG: hypothetical protein CVT59_11235 [Actinobacteria bacterium HGW-Actinobacteria-1]